MFGKKKQPPAPTELKCPVCGFVCMDKSSMDRHIEWNHPEAAAKKTT